MNSIPIPKTSLPTFVSQQTDDAEYYFLNHSPSPHEDLTVFCGGMERCAEDYLIDRTSLPYYTIEFVAQGTCRITLDNKTMNLGPGSVYCYGPSNPHRIENLGDGPLIKFFVCLQGRKVTDLLWQSFLKHNRPLQVPEYRWIHDLFRMLQDCGQRNGTTAQSSCQLIVRLILDRVEQLSSCANNQCHQALMTYQRCRSFISENFATIHSVAEVAEHCAIHRAYLAQLFTKFAQTTPSQLLNHYKMNAAAKLLLEGKLLVKEVAAAVGFDDPFHFSQSFKKFYGISPRNFAGQYRISETCFLSECAANAFREATSPPELSRVAGG
jgi:AraC-like DNA-binding protein